MVSAGGLNPSNASWVESLEFEQREIAELWRCAVTSYLWKADQNGLLRPSATPNEFADLVLSQTQRRWNIHITRRMTKQHFLGYAGRYIRRLPLSQRRILRVSGEEVVYQSKDTRTNVLLEARCTPTAFVDLLSQHVPDHYRDSMRYFGLLAPRTKRTTSECISNPWTEAPISSTAAGLEELPAPRFPD